MEHSEPLAPAGKAKGLKSIELLMPGDFYTLRKHGIKLVSLKQGLEICSV